LSRDFLKKPSSQHEQNASEVIESGTYKDSAKEALAAVLDLSLPIQPRTYISPQYVDLNVFDLIAETFYSGILSPKMDF
jgi:hypothetical protein